MSEHGEQNVDVDRSLPSHAEAALEAPAPDARPPSGPTAADRKRLLHALQAQALQQTNPLAACLTIASGDLLGLANVMQPVLAELHSSPARAMTKATAKFTDRFVRIVGQFVRFAQLQAGLSPGQKDSEPEP